MLEKDLVIIGGGPAGLTAGIYGKRSELDLVILDSGIGGGQIANAGLVENYPGFPEGIRGMELAEVFKQHAMNAGVEIRILEEVKDIVKDRERFLVTSSKEKYRAKAVIVATGQVYKKLGVPGEAARSGRGVSYCATCDGAFFKGKRVAVIGGGTAAAMAALNLSDLAKEIFVVTRSDGLNIRERIIETRLKKARNIKVISKTIVKEIKGENSVTGIDLETEQGRKTIAADGVFVEVGKKPRTSFLESLGMELKKGYVITDKKQMSSIPGIFCAGDIVSGGVKQVSVAVAQGTIAALSAYDFIKNKL